MYMHKSIPSSIACNELMLYHRSSQPDLKYKTVASLRSLTGWEWGGYGNMVFFIMGAYQDSNGDMQTFK